MDIKQGWRERALEQVIVAYRGQALKKPAASAPRETNDGGESILGILPTGLSSADRALLCAIERRTAHRLGEFCRTARGLPLQRQVARAGVIPVLAGRHIAPMASVEISGWLCEDAEALDRGRVRPDQAVFQNIVAHLRRPTDHLRLIGTVVDEPLVCLDTVNLMFADDPLLTGAFLAAYLQSDLVNWFVYVAIYNRACRTMHFDNFAVKRIPLPERSAWPAIGAAAERLRDEPRDAERWRRLNALVFDAFGISNAQGVWLTGLHKPRGQAA